MLLKLKSMIIICDLNLNTRVSTTFNVNQNKN